MTGAILSYGIYEDERERLEREALQAARVLMQAIDSELIKAQATILTLSKSEHLRTGNLAAFHVQAKEVIQATGVGNNYVLSDLAGQQVLNTALPYPSSLPMHGNPEQVRRVAQSGLPAISDVFFGPVVRRPLVTIDVPVLRGGKLAYVLSNGLLPDHFNQLLARQELPKGWIAAVLDSQGTVAARNLDPERMVGRKATPDLLARLAVSAEGTMSSRTLEGNPSFIAFSRSETTRWAVVFGMTRDVLYSNIYRPLAWAALAMLAFLVGGALLASTFSHRVRRALEALGDAAEAAKLGGRDARAPLSSGIGEISRLADQFNRMQEARKQAEDALRQSEDELKQAQRIAYLGNWRYDLAVNQTHWSGEIYAMFGLDPALPAPNFGEHQKLFTPESLKQLDAAVETARATGAPYELELEIVRQDGSPGWVWVRGEAVKGANGEIVALRGVTQDISERKETQAQLETYRLELERLVEARTQDLVVAKEAAEAANRAKSTFLANMSHELRTPMNAIMGMTDIVLRRIEDPRLRDQLAIIEKASRNLLTVIDDILDISRIEADRLELAQRDFTLGAVVDHLTSLISDKAASRGLQLRIDLPPTLGRLALHGDPLRLGQILLNLTTNAIKFTEAGTVALRASLNDESATAVGLRFEVQDTGIGIRPEDSKRIFNAFEQVDGSMTRRYSGTGLGLAISKRLVQTMNGAIGVDSEPGVGSTFWFTVKLDKASATRLAAPPAPSSSARSALGEYAGSRVLVAEDEPMNQEVSRSLLEDAGLVVDVAEDGGAAVALARENRYALILMDMQMPKLNGVDATRVIRTLPGYERTPILALTANAFDGDRQLCIAAGMNDHIGKPVRPDKLFETLLKWLSIGTSDQRT